MMWRLCRPPRGIAPSLPSSLIVPSSDRLGPPSSSAGESRQDRRRSTCSRSLSLTYPPPKGVSGTRVVQPDGTRVASVECCGPIHVRHRVSPQSPSADIRWAAVQIPAPTPPLLRETEPPCVQSRSIPITRLSATEKRVRTAAGSAGRCRSPFRHREACQVYGWSSREVHESPASSGVAPVSSATGHRPSRRRSLSAEAPSRYPHLSSLPSTGVS